MDFGNLLRFPENAPAKLALNEIKLIKRSNRCSWKKLVNKDFKTINFNYFIECENIGQMASDREWWTRKIVVEA